MKGKITLILAIVAGLFLVGNLFSCIDAGRSKSARNKEMSIRLDAEEKLNKVTQDKSALETKFAKTSKELEEERSAHQATKKMLLQEQMVNESLKEELQKVMKLKEKLEGDLKEVVAGDKATKSKK